MASELYLDCASTPLTQGVNLVEASAGTGKTYAIAMLVLRSITELDIPIDRILVVTFTKAATEELRGRIRARLAEARDLLAGGNSKDSTITAWAQTVTDIQAARERLQRALLDIDRAGIFTIHSFCQRMLTEQALESGQLFDVELLADIDRLRGQVVEDYWRRRLYPLSPRACGLVVGKYPTPAALYASVARAGNASARLEPEGVAVEQAVRAFAAEFGQLADWWNRSAAALQAACERALVAGQFKKPLSDEFMVWWSSLSAYFSGVDFALPAHMEFLSREGLKGTLNATRVKKAIQDVFLADWPLADGLVTDFLQAADVLVLALRRELLDTVRTELEARLHDRGHMSFDDLISRLDKGLAANREGLRTILRERFSVALIDEFQDTDAAQWRIFSTLFGGAGHYLYLIGDPKQAIYRFRGADIFSYFAAKEVADRHFTLRHNYRSHPHLVEEVNRTFSGRTRPFAFAEERMPFTPAVPAKTAEAGTLYQDGRPLEMMVYCQLSEWPKESNGRWSSGRAGERFREYVIGEICRLLDGASPVHRRKVEDGNVEQTVLQARDIAVLVRSNYQADEYLQAFARAGIPAVAGTRKSVFETEECRELFLLLQALAAPADVFRLKSAMTVSWFGLAGDRLMGIWQDEADFDGWFNRFLLYHQLWRERGFLAMMNRLLQDEEVYLSLAQAEMAERRIANIHHLLELVQEAETTEKLGPEQTLLWLRSMAAGKTGEEDRELRLESDEQAVRIVTMHSAKGLQYPVVFCPYLWYRSDRLAGETNLLSCHDQENGEVVDLGSPDFETRRQQAMAEELAEDLRLAYVALTRAELRCYVMWADVKRVSGKVASSADSALGYLFFPAGTGGYAEQSLRLQRLAEGPGVEHLELAAEEISSAAYRPVVAEVDELAALTPGARSLHTDYQMSSYSAMASLSEQEDHGSETEEDDGGEEGIPIRHPGLPAGANFGNLVHDALEMLPFAALGAGADHSADLVRLCKRYGVALETGTVQELLTTIVNTPLLSGPDTFSLAGLDEDRCLCEMPFYFHMEKLETAKINEILAGQPTVSQLSHKVMQGYLTGFVDLVCEHEGRYYILDYKSNFLGNTMEDYRPDRLVRAMASHNYGLQYWIYTLVLHRYLGNVLPDYSYERHFGGVLYLFVRGMAPEVPGSGVFFTLPSPELLQRLDQAVGGGL